MTWANIPFLGTGNTFWGRTVWDWLRKPKYNFCDVIDRVNCSFVPAMLLFFVAIVSANIFGFNHNDPMRCLKSQELTNEEFEYALEICQTKNGMFHFVFVFFSESYIKLYKKYSYTLISMI
jgi:hypothetical protein